MDLIDKSSSVPIEQIDQVNEPYSLQEQENKKPAEDRFVMLCDGIFAIAITLLVINIKLPDNLPDEKSFNSALGAEFSSQIIYYVITFAVIAGFWRLHRRITHTLKHLDNRFIIINFVFLAFIAFFPVTSSFLGQYTYPGAIILYTLTIAGCDFSVLAMWLYAAWHHQLIEQTISREEIIAFSIHTAWPPVYFCLSLLLLLSSFIRFHQPVDVFWSWLFLPVVSFLVRRVSRGRVTRWLVGLADNLVSKLRRVTRRLAGLYIVSLAVAKKLTSGL